MTDPAANVTAETTSRRYAYDLSNRAGGRLLTDLPKPPNLSREQFSIQTLDDAAAQGSMVRFDLTNMRDIEGTLAGTGKFARSVTGAKLRHIQSNWSAFEGNVKFYLDGKEVLQPW